MNIDADKILSRGTILTCFEDGCKSVAIVLRKGQLPDGWCVLVAPARNEQEPYEVQSYCAKHDPVWQA